MPSARSPLSVSGLLNHESKSLIAARFSAGIVRVVVVVTVAAATVLVNRALRALEVPIIKTRLGEAI